MNIRRVVRKLVPNQVMERYWRFRRESGAPEWSRLFSKFNESYNVLSMADFMAAVDSARFYERNLMACKLAEDDFKLLDLANSWRSLDGLSLEFGVASGRTINHIAKLIVPDKVYGFDWFGGLPETWRPGFSAGSFAQKMPDVDDNVQLITGLFGDTLPAFIETHPGIISFLHIDCDLYSSTKVILDNCSSRIVPGTVIVFDEYFNYPGWRQHEFRAFREYISASGRHFEYLGFVPKHQQVCVRITA